MPHGVVETLEVVDVDDGERQPPAPPIGAPPFQCERRVEPAAVGDTGERVDRCEALEQVARALELDMRPDARPDDRRPNRLRNVVDAPEVEAVRLVTAG